MVLWRIDNCLSISIDEHNLSKTLYDAIFIITGAGSGAAAGESKKELTRVRFGAKF